ncbi:HSF-type DNA-binding-domain-containing protein [Phycomyces nitens]|nr:HSF-type DNA-binding-domain-containing protein [Phycomyces nitens]
MENGDLSEMKGHNSAINLSRSNSNDFPILSTSPNTKTQAAFVNKVYKMLEDPEIQEMISWSRSGDLFSVANPTLFSKIVLPQYFKHNNWQSFVRQLNMYGFHKVNDMIHSNLTNETQTWEFRHPHFRRGAVDDLQNIKRKSAKSNTMSPARPLRIPDNADAEEDPYIPLQKHLHTVEDQLLTVTNACDILRSEVGSLRVILLKQQEIMQDMLGVFTVSHNDHEQTKKRKTCQNNLEKLRHQVVQLKEYTRVAGQSRPSDDFNYFSMETAPTAAWPTVAPMRHSTSESEANTPNRRSSDNSSLISETSTSHYRPSMVTWKASMSNSNTDEEMHTRMRSMSTHSATKMKAVNYPKSRKHSHETVSSTSPSERPKNIRQNIKPISSVDCLTDFKDNSSHIPEEIPVVRNVMGLGKRSRLLNPEPSEEKSTSGKYNLYIYIDDYNQSINNQ